MANGANAAGNATLIGNQAVAGDGGAILVTAAGASPQLNLFNTILALNTASGEGGAIRVVGESFVTIINCTLAGNSAMAIIQRHSTRASGSRGVFEGDTTRDRLREVQKPRSGTP